MKLESCFLCGGKNATLIHKGVRGGDNINVLRCADCGHVRLSDVMEDVDSFYRNSGMRDGVTASLEEIRRNTQDDDERRFLFTEKMIRGKKVLDFGCGDGGYILRAQKSAREVAGVELETSVREALQREGIVCYDSVEEYGEVDVVTMFHVLEHIDAPISLLKDIARHLSAGGQIVVEVPNAEDALLSLYGCEDFADFTYWKCHIYLYTEDTLRRLAKKAGLRVRFMQQVQRYPLSNHLHWLSKGRPGGHFVWSFLDEGRLSECYGNKLAKLGIADTIIAGFSKG